MVRHRHRETNLPERVGRRSAAHVRNSQIRARLVERGLLHAAERVDAAPIRTIHAFSLSLLTENPIEAGLGWITRTDKGPFVGREAIVKMKREGPARRLVGFALNDRAFPRQGYVLRKDGTETGSVTSGTFSPTLDRGIGMGYVTRADAAPGTCITVSIRNREIPATVVPLPFIAKK